MHCRSLFLLLVFSCILLGCTDKSEPSTVTGQAVGAPYVGYETLDNGDLGFSFTYPASWTTRTSELPTQWAANSPKGDTLLFTVSPAASDNLLALGQTQALRDSVSKDSNKISADQLQNIGKTVKLSTFGNQEWYTYAISFGSSQATSIISGTLCNNNEVLMVMVTTDETIVENRRVYEDALNSFQCA